MTYDLNAIRLENYRNSAEVVSGLTVEDIVKACLIGRLNMFFVGETGEGKTQLENDILGLFGNHGFFEQGRNDLTVKEMFTRLNLDKLRSGHSSDEVKELTEHVGHPIYVVDELTRCIPAVQNQFFNLFDGFITVDGTKRKLGMGGYSVGIASGNVGNGRYVGTSETDRALRDRMHLILDVDYFPLTARDTAGILARKKDPRVGDADGLDYTAAILEAHRDLSARSPSLLQYIGALYFKHGLDYLEAAPHSKRQSKQAWPGNVSGHETGSDAAVIFPFSTRAAISTLTLAGALETVKAAKGDAYADDLDAVLDAAYLVGAQSGVLHPSAVDSKYNGNPYAAMSAVIEGIRGEFAAKVPSLESAVASAAEGQLAYVDEFSGRWGFVTDVLAEAAEQAKAQRPAPKPAPVPLKKAERAR